MDKSEKYELRNHMPMSPFVILIDDITMFETIKKAKVMGLKWEGPKGPIAAIVRVMLNNFAAGKYEVSKEDIEAEVLFTKNKNKRSSM